ncbi:hypothetical protein Lal_00017216 [Lupinus albus]|nr:hypothetical protein Lal_00017216 [Lupinus albus]
MISKPESNRLMWRGILERAGLFYPGDGVVDSLLAPRGSTTKRLKESDLVVTQPRAGLFYPGDGVVDSLLAPRGSTTKRLKESDLVVTQPGHEEAKEYEDGNDYGCSHGEFEFCYHHY